MVLHSRLWRVLRGYASDFSDADPDEIIKQWRQRQQVAKAKNQGSAKAKQAPPPKPKGPPDELARAYARLEIQPGASKDEVKAAWRKLMRKYHPDKHQSDERKREVATKVAAALTEAYETIRMAQGR